MGAHWGCRNLGDIVGIGETATLKLAQVSSKVTEVWIRLDGWANMMYYDRKSFFPIIHPQKTENQLSIASIPQTPISHHHRLLAKL